MHGGMAGDEVVLVVERGGGPYYTITLRVGSAERGREEKKIKPGLG